jgi:ABC-type lipoprotein release transport system permease subunit
VTLAGLLVGTVLATASSRVLVAFLAEVPPRDPLAFAAAAVGVAAAAMLACLPAVRRAAATEPVEVLRPE